MPTNDLCAVQLTFLMPGKDFVAEIQLPNDFESMTAAKDDGEDMEGSLVLFESNSGGEIQQLPKMVAGERENTGRGKSIVEVEEPIPLNSFHPIVSDWVIQKALEIKHCIGVTCDGFEDEFMALLKQ